MERSLRCCIGAAMIAILVGGTSVVKAQDTRLRAVLEWQDQRLPVDSVIIAALQDSSSSIRKAALIALANKQDSTAVGLVQPLLTDSQRDVQEAAAFCLGQIPCATSAMAVRNALGSEKDPGVRSALAEAIGKVGSSDDIRILLSREEDESSRLPDSMVVAGLLRFAIRGLRNEAMILRCFSALENPSPDVRWRALYALWRVAPNAETDKGIAAHSMRLRALCLDPDPDVRMQLAPLLGRSSSDTAVVILQELYAAEQNRPDWRVQVQLMRAAAQQAAAHPVLLRMLTAGLSDSNPHVVITALQGVTALSPSVLKDSTAQRDTIRAALRMLSAGGSGQIEAVQGEAIVATGRQFEVDLNRVLPLLNRPSVPPQLKAKILEGVAQHASRPSLHILMQNLDHDSVRVAMAAWDFLHRVVVPPVVQILKRDSTSWAPIPAMLVRSGLQTLERHDGGLATVVAGFFADSVVWGLAFDARQQAAIRSGLCEALRHMKSAEDAEAMQAVIGTLGLVGDSTCASALQPLRNDADVTVAEAARTALQRLTGRDDGDATAVYRRPQHIDEDWATLAWARSHPIVSMITSRGGVKLELLPDAAPWTVVTFVKLVRSGFYDGLTFHRVVPNFVVQGGDPRGDGWGGPGFTIRTEISTEEYKRGTCGIASAGKDTEGCQFFITHCPTPHLDGRYTIFARVIEGMTAVDRIQIGDRILSVSLDAR